MNRDLLPLVRVSVWERFNPATGEYVSVSEHTHVPGTDVQTVAIVAIRDTADALHRPGSGNVRVVLDVWDPSHEVWRHVATLRVYRAAAPFLTLRHFWQTAPTVALRVLGAVALEAERYGWDASDVKDTATDTLMMETAA